MPWQKYFSPLAETSFETGQMFLKPEKNISWRYEENFSGSLVGKQSKHQHWEWALEISEDWTLAFQSNNQSLTIKPNSHQCFKNKSLPPQCTSFSKYLLGNSEHLSNIFISKKWYKSRTPCSYLTCLYDFRSNLFGLSKMVIPVTNIFAHTQARL